MDVPEILQQLIDDGIIDDVRARLMSGKEASVFVVERGGELIAAKVYKGRDQRTFRSTSSYTEGRNQTRNSRDKRAMQKRTRYGAELVEASWRDMEYRALHDAFHAGVRVPEPFLLYENVLLMELLVDEQGAPAPRLADFELTPEVATLLHREIYGQVRLLLRSGRIHGDLSAFNILIPHAGPTLIDMPQVVDASMNNSAPSILQRDLQNVTEHLARFDARLLRFRDCGSVLWEHFRRGDIDRCLEPEEGGVRRHDARGHHGRRTRDAERNRAGRGALQETQGPTQRPRQGGHENPSQNSPQESGVKSQPARNQHQNQNQNQNRNRNQNRDQNQNRNQNQSQNQQRQPQPMRQDRQPMRQDRQPMRQDRQPLRPVVAREERPARDEPRPGQNPPRHREHTQQDSPQQHAPRRQDEQRRPARDPSTRR